MRFGYMAPSGKPAGALLCHQGVQGIGADLRRRPGLGRISTIKIEQCRQIGRGVRPARVLVSAGSSRRDREHSPHQPVAIAMRGQRRSGGAGDSERVEIRHRLSLGELPP